MKKELEEIIIGYNTCDLPYIEEAIAILKNEIKPILDFFTFTKFVPKVTLRLWPDLEKYRNVFAIENQNRIGSIQKINETTVIEVVSLKEVKKIKYYENTTIKDFAHLLLHEFVHVCHFRYTTTKSYIWLWEGLATFLSSQYKETNFFTATLEEMKKRKNTDYREFYTMFLYVYQTYGKNYIWKLLNNFTLQEKETPRLYKETKEYIKKKERVL